MAGWITSTCLRLVDATPQESAPRPHVIVTVQRILSTGPTGNRGSRAPTSAGRPFHLGVRICLLAQDTDEARASTLEGKLS